MPPSLVPASVPPSPVPASVPPSVVPVGCDGVVCGVEGWVLGVEGADCDWLYDGVVAGGQPEPVPVPELPSSVEGSEGAPVSSSVGVGVGDSSLVLLECVVVGLVSVPLPPSPPAFFSASATPAAIATTASTARIHSLPRPLPLLPCPSKPPSSPLP